MQVIVNENDITFDLVQKLLNKDKCIFIRRYNPDDLHTEVTFEGNEVRADRDC